MNVVIYNQGCIRESAMAQNLKEDLKNKGNSIVSDLREADAIVYISCAGTGDSIEKCFRDLDFFLALKKKETKFILTGCLANKNNFWNYLYRKDFKLIENPDFVIPIENYLFEETKRNSYKSILRNRTLRVANNNVSVQFLIEEGCINHCSFCKYNYLKRYVKSVPYSIALDYLKELIENGTKCITLSGENTTLYGLDLEGKPLLHQFIHDLSLIEKLERIYLGEITSQNLYPELLAEIIKNPKIYRVDMQLEMAPNRLLGLMKRNHKLEEYAYYIKKIQESGKFISTVLMCSFPTETYEDLDFTIDFIKKNHILVEAVLRYRDCDYIPSHYLERLSYNESRRHATYLKKQIALVNKELMTQFIPFLQDSIVIGKTDQIVCFDNVINGYSFRKGYQDCNLGDTIVDKPQCLVRTQENNYTYNYKW